MQNRPTPQLFASEARRGRCGFGQAQIKANSDMRFYDGTHLHLVQCAPLLKTQASQHSFLALETVITRCNDILSKALVAFLHRFSGDGFWDAEPAYLEHGQCKTPVDSLIQAVGLEIRCLRGARGVS
jgi:hypothetical protein